MTDSLRKTIRSFLEGEGPASREEALGLVHEWFDRYSPEPGLLAEEVDRYFADGGGGSGRERVLNNLSASA